MAGESGVEVTLAMIARSAKKLRRRNDESLESFAGRMTHVSLCARGISEFVSQGHVVLPCLLVAVRVTHMKLVVLRPGQRAGVPQDSGTLFVRE